MIFAPGTFTGPDQQAGYTAEGWPAVQVDVTHPSAATVADFHRQRGYQVARTESCWWFNEYHQKYMLYSFPAHRTVVPTQEETEALFHRFRSALALRFIGPAEGAGKPGFLWMCRRPYALSGLGRNTRPKILKGLKQCSIRRLSFAELARIAWPAHADTQSRHGQRAGGLGFDATLDTCSAYEAWGAFREGMLLAYVVVLLVDDCASMIITRSTDASLKHRPNYALVFSVVSELLSRENIKAVSYGWDSLAPNAGLETFKSRLGFAKEPVRQNIVIRPALRPFVNKGLCSRIIRTVRPERLPYRLQQVYGLCQILAAN